MRRWLVTITSLAFLAFTLALAEEHGKMESKSGDKPNHIMLTGADLKWVEGPPSLPAGAKLAVIEGDPSQPGLFTMRLKLPANYKVPAHWHPADEHVTVISGSFLMGLGDKFDEKAPKELPPGGFAVMAIGTRHFAMSKEGGVVQVHGMGPWGINYVNPADDPRLARPSK